MAVTGSGKYPCSKQVQGHITLTVVKQAALGKFTLDVDQASLQPITKCVCGGGAEGSLLLKRSDTDRSPSQPTNQLSVT